MRFESLPSTNQWMLDNAAGCAAGDVAWAVSQTAGRGRFNRPWLTPPGACLTASFALTADRPGCDEPTRCVQAAAVAVARMLATHALRALVKWPNDVLARGRKIAGILAEQDSGTGLLALGIGINVNLSAADLRSLGLADTATSMALETGSAFDVGDVLGDLAAALEDALGRLARGGTRWLRAAWRRRDALAGATVGLTAAEGPVEGAYAGVAADGRLRLRDSHGRLHLFWSGDVALLRRRRIF